MSDAAARLVEPGSAAAHLNKTHRLLKPLDVEGGDAGEKEEEQAQRMICGLPVNDLPNIALLLLLYTLQGCVGEVR